MIKFVGFDKDGTLLDSQQAISKEWGEIIQNDFGIDAKEAEEVFGVIAVGQPTVTQLDLTLRKGNVYFPPEQLFEKANEIAIRLGQNVKADPFPEVPDVLKELKDSGYFIFISSGHQESVIKNDLERTGLVEYIDYYLGIRPNEPTFKKGESHFRDIASHFQVNYEFFVMEAVFVGDTPSDIEAADSCGMISIVRSGTLSKEKLVEAGANFVIPDLSSLPEILKSL